MNCKKLIICMGTILMAATGCSKPESRLLKDGIGTCIGCDFDRVAPWQVAGGNYVEIHIAAFLMPEQGDEDFRENVEKARQSALPIRSGSGFFPGDIRLTGPDADMERALRYTEVAMRRASEIGMEVAVLGSGQARAIPEGFSREEAEKQFETLLSGMGKIAKKYGVTIVIEPLNRKECNYINTVQEAYEIAKRVNHPNIRVLADLYHMAQEGESPQSILNAGRKYLRHVHIAEKEHRTSPGVEGDDFTPYFQALKEIGYEGTISIECGWSDFEKQAPVAVAEMQRQLHKVFDKN